MLPHAVRILERDSAADVGIVRDSAVKGMAEIEGIIHVRLPAQEISVQRKTEDGEEDESANGDVESVEDTVMETITERNSHGSERRQTIRSPSIGDDFTAVCRNFKYI